MILDNGADLTTELSSIVLLLRDVQARSRSSDLAIKQVAWILPLIKNPANLELLLAEISAAAPAIVGTTELAALFTDVISSATSRKEKISHPTIPVTEWLDIVLEWAYNPRTPALVALCASSGIVRVLPENKAAQALCVASATQIGHHSTDAGELSATIACLSRAQWGLSDESKQLLPAKSLLKPTILAIYSGPDALDVGRPMLSAEFGAYSRLLATFAAHPQISELQLFDFIDSVDIYLRHAVALWSFSSLDAALKTLLFGVSLQFEGVASHLLHRKLPGRIRLASRVLLALQPLGAVIEGTGRFESLEFVEAVVADTLLGAGPGAADEACEALAAPFQYGIAPGLLGQLLYTLETVERLRQALSPRARHDLLLEAQRFLIPPSLPDSLNRAVFEASHSLVLALLGNEAAAASYDYLATILRLYPGQLFSYTQFCTALDGVTAAVMEDSQRQRVLIALFDRAKTIIPGIPTTTQGNEGPPTERAAVLGGFLRALPALCRPSEFAIWLDRLGAAIPQLVYQPYVEAERKWLLQEASSMVGNLNLELADIGIRWWFGFSRQSRI